MTGKVIRVLRFGMKKHFLQATEEIWIASSLGVKSCDKDYYEKDCVVAWRCTERKESNTIYVCLGKHVGEIWV